MFEKVPFLAMMMRICWSLMDLPSVLDSSSSSFLWLSTALGLAVCQTLGATLLTGNALVLSSMRLFLESSLPQFSSFYVVLILFDSWHLTGTSMDRPKGRRKGLQTYALPHTYRARFGCFCTHKCAVPAGVSSQTTPADASIFFLRAA